MNRRLTPRSRPRSGSRPRPSPQEWRRRSLGFAVLAVVALAAAAGIAAGDGPRPVLDIGVTATDTAAVERDVGPTVQPGLEPRPGPLDRPAALGALPNILIGDQALRGRIDLGSMVEEGGGYEVRLPDGRRALLTLDPALQKQALKLLAHSRAPMGAIVAMTPDGRILALAGRKHGPPADEKAYDLATTVWAPAASVFKLVTAAALLQAGVGPTDPVCFHGGIRRVEASNLVDDRRRDRHCKDLTFAVAESQNAIVAKLAHRFLDRRKLAAAASAFGLGKAPAFSLACEASRVSVPDGGLEQARFAAGFWSSELSALDGALLAGVVATGGMRVTPRIVSEVVEKDGKRRKVVAVAPERAISARVAAQIGSMMVKTTETGTAGRAFRHRGHGPLVGIKVAGKTGSLSREVPSFVGYSWFVGFAPSDRPRVIIAVLFGNPESWYLKAHTAARMLLEVALAKNRGD